MNLKEKIHFFNKRWNIVEDSNYQTEFEKFKTRAINIFSDIDAQVTEDGLSKFCQIMAIPEESEFGNMYGNAKGRIIRSLIVENNERKFYFLIEVIFCLPFETSIIPHVKTGDQVKSLLYMQLSEAIELSNINLATTVNNGEVILFPRGEREFDNKMVEDVLSFLSIESQKHFVDALKFYENSNPIKSAESIRRSVEEFMKVKLKNTKGLKANIRMLQDYLKQDGRDSNIRNIIQQVFSYLDQYFNENSKHHDGKIDEVENEYLIYQAGLLMRYINGVIANTGNRDV